MTSLLPDISRLFLECGFSPKKRLSQNFLIDPRVLLREAQRAEAKGKKILEIGPGPGFLTSLLAKDASSLTAIEKDAKLCELLKEKFADSPHVEIIHGDFLKHEFRQSFDLIISNVPYSISSPLLFRLPLIQFSRAILCLQKEFVQRMMAKPNTSENSRLTIMSQLHFNIRKLENIPRTAFHPAPKVDSILIQLMPTGVKIDEFTSSFIAKLFQQRKKTVRAVLHHSSLPTGTPFDSRRIFSLSKEELLELAHLTAARGGQLAYPSPAH